MSELFVYIFSSWLPRLWRMYGVLHIGWELRIGTYSYLVSSSSVPAIPTLALRKQLHKQHANFAMVHANIKLAKNPEWR